MTQISTLLFGILGMTVLVSCSPKTEFELISNQKLCVDKEQVVVADILTSGVTKEVTIFKALNDLSDNLSGDVYIHITLLDNNFTPNLYTRLERRLALVDKYQLPIYNGLLKLEDENSVGVFHLFDSPRVPTMKDYIGSCFTLSDTMGKCSIAASSGKYNLKADIPLAAINEWKLIKKYVMNLPDNLSCKQ